MPRGSLPSIDGLVDDVSHVVHRRVADHGHPPGLGVDLDSVDVASRWGGIWVQRTCRCCRARREVVRAIRAARGPGRRSLQQVDGAIRPPHPNRPPRELHVGRRGLEVMGGDAATLLDRGVAGDRRRAARHHHGALRPRSGCPRAPGRCRLDQAHRGRIDAEARARSPPGTWRGAPGPSAASVWSATVPTAAKRSSTVSSEGCRRPLQEHASPIPAAPRALGGAACVWEARPSASARRAVHHRLELAAV
jgi:hypothetical protein